MPTIFALATAPGRSGVAVVRISGSEADVALAALGVTPLPPARMAILSGLYHPTTKELLDRALVLRFVAPASFTGEDVVELHLHGGRAVIDGVLQALSGLTGLRLAEPGEFTRRAFLNGKLDLTAAEGLADLIDAETVSQQKQAMRAMDGEMERYYAGLRDGVLKLMALLEAYIDFPDEEIPESVLEEIEETRRELVQKIDGQLAGVAAGERIREGLRVAIIGPPNSGKSTLLNRLSGREAAIVSAEAGTTRDIVEVRLDLGGLVVTLADTAGIREGAGAVEREGIARAQAQAQEADIVLAVFDPFSLAPPDPDILELIQENTALLLNKSDLGSPPLADWLEGVSSRVRFEISAEKNKGINALTEWLQLEAKRLTTTETPPMITRLRHRRALEMAKRHLEDFAREIAPELQCEQLRRAATELGKITGRISVEEILGEIFGRFCIGK